MPPWVAAVLLFVAIWLGARILDNVTEALTGTATASVDVAAAPTRPVH